MEIYVFDKTSTLTCRTHVKVTLLMKTCNVPTVITDILPQAVSHKPIMKSFFEQKCSFLIFQQTVEFEEQHKRIWLRNLGLQFQIWGEGGGQLRKGVGAREGLSKGGGGGPEAWCVKARFGDETWSLTPPAGCPKLVCGLKTWVETRPVATFYDMQSAW